MRETFILHPFAFILSPTMSRFSLAARALILGGALLGTGFFVGLGFQSRASQQARSAPQAKPMGTPAPAPLVKGLRSSPDGRLLAFTGIYNNYGRGCVWIVDLQTTRARARASPAGWQDYVAAWRDDGRALLIEREKIPRPAAKAKAGIYSTPVDGASLSTGEPENMTPDLPRGEKIVSGLYAPDGTLVLKTRSDPKKLFRVEGKNAIPIDRAAITYGQNRAVKVGNRTIYYVMRDIAGEPDKIALFRVENAQARQISPAWSEDEVVWSYVSPSGKQLLLAGYEGEEDWKWTLFDIEGDKVKRLRSATIPGDVITVYWSPDEKQIVGAAGEKLWRIGVPDLIATELGTRSDWNADDVTWIGNSNALAVAAGGELWRVDVPTGKATKIWRFPDEYWK